MSDILSPTARALLARPVLASLATIAADGSPRSHLCGSTSTVTTSS